MKKKLEIKCQICKKKFIPNRPWHKYCSSKCRGKGKSLNVLLWRKKQSIDIEELTVEQIKNKKPYQQAYENIMKAFVDNREEGLSWSELYMKSGLKDKTLFIRFQYTLCRLGVLKKEEKRYLPSQRYKFEPLKLREKDIILNTNMECTIFRPTTGYSFVYYTPKIQRDYLESSVKNLNKRIEEMEVHLKKAEDIWIITLCEARDNFMRESWDKKILCNKAIHVLTKFDFCLNIIFNRQEPWLREVSSPERTSIEQWDSLMDIKRRAFDKYIQKRYPLFTQPQIKKLHIDVDEEYESKKDFFSKLFESTFNLKLGILDHMIVIDFLGVPTYRFDELRELGTIKAVTFNNNKPIGMQRDKLKKLPDKKYYDSLADKDSSTGHKVKTVDEKLYVKPPFFKSFFQGFEKDLKGLGFKKDGANGLEEFYKDLDETAEIFKIPSLPDSPNGLLRKNHHFES